MASIERTAYPRFKPSLTAKELQALYEPTEEERDVGVFCPTPRKDIFQGDTIGTSSGGTETGQRWNDHICLNFQ
jgi:hypothetical protein